MAAAQGEDGAVIDGLQQQGAAVGGHAATVKAGAHCAAALIGQIDCDTVCGHGACLWEALNLLISKMLPQMHTTASDFSCISLND